MIHHSHQDVAYKQGGRSESSGRALHPELYSEGIDQSRWQDKRAAGCNE